MIAAVNIGRHELRVTDVVSVTRRLGLAGWWRPGYNAQLANGRTLYFTDKEKARFDYERNLHEQTVRIYGMAKAAGARGL